jgi:hypothetical protein
MAYKHGRKEEQRRQQKKDANNSRGLKKEQRYKQNKGRLTVTLAAARTKHLQ